MSILFLGITIVSLCISNLYVKFEAQQNISRISLTMHKICSEFAISQNPFTKYDNCRASSNSDQDIEKCEGYKYNRDISIAIDTRICMQSIEDDLGANNL